MRTSSTLNFAHTLWCVIRQDHSIIDVVSPWTQVYSVQHFFLWQWHVALFNYVQCPRNYCDSVTLNQCLINNKIIIIIIIVRTLKRLWAWHQWQKICAYSLQMPLSVKVINIKAHNNILMFCCSWTTVHVSETTYLPVCETRKSAAQNSEKNWKHSCFRRTAAHRDFFWLLRLINTLTYIHTDWYLLTYLLTIKSIQDTVKNQYQILVEIQPRKWSLQ